MPYVSDANHSAVVILSGITGLHSTILLKFCPANILHFTVQGCKNVFFNCTMVDCAQLLEVVQW